MTALKTMVARNGSAMAGLPSMDVLHWRFGVRVSMGPGWLRSVMTLWCHRSRTRRALRTVDDRALADIGITPAERAAECRKWFWRL